MTVNMALTSLLVCSDAQAVQVLSRILQDLGIGVESCGDPRMAQARLENQHFDALLVDCQDEKAAVELIAQARSAPSNQPTIAIAIVSGRNQVRDILIAETALKLDATLVSGDVNLRQMLSEFGGAVMSRDQFKV